MLSVDMCVPVLLKKNNNNDKITEESSGTQLSNKSSYWEFERYSCNNAPIT